MTKTSTKNRPGSQKVTGQRKKYKLIKFLNAKLDSGSEKVAMQAATTLTQLFLRMDEDAENAANRAFRRAMAKINAQAAAAVQAQSAVPVPGELEVNIDWERFHELYGIKKEGEEQEG
jgi:hypothetical protein